MTECDSTEQALMHMGAWRQRPTIPTESAYRQLLFEAFGFIAVCGGTDWTSSGRVVDIRTKGSRHFASPSRRCLKLCCSTLQSHRYGEESRK
jgi:hypothetical protein